MSEKPTRWFVERPDPLSAGHIQICVFDTEAEAREIETIWRRSSDTTRLQVWSWPLSEEARAASAPVLGWDMGAGDSWTVEHKPSPASAVPPDRNGIAVKMAEMLASHRGGYDGSDCSDINDPGSCERCATWDAAIKALSSPPPSASGEGERHNYTENPQHCHRCALTLLAIYEARFDMLCKSGSAESYLSALRSALTAVIALAEFDFEGVMSRSEYDAIVNSAKSALASASSGDAGTGAEAAFDFVAHLQRQREWSERTFGPGPRTDGVVDHIRKELYEIHCAPTDLSEWIDVVILALDGAWRAGHSPEAIVAALVAKQTKNESRAWPDWRTADPGKAIEHVRASPKAGPA